jgi:hypothetical protein
VEFSLTEKQHESLKALLVWAELYFLDTRNVENVSVMDDLESVFHYRT